MKKLLSIILLAGLCSIATMAVPAFKGRVAVEQPDGTTVTVLIHGDEYLNFRTTTDGYTLAEDAQGFLCYAVLNGEQQLEATSHRAHDEAQRSAAETAMLSGMQKMLVPAATQRAEADKRAEQMRQAKTRQARRAEGNDYFDYSKFRGLVILVEYNDQSFIRDDYRDLMDNMINKRNFKSYRHNNRTVSCTGSVRDYFYDNSAGIFDPHFDVVGPVKVNRSVEFPKGTENASVLMMEAIKAADDQVDFSLYDTDGDYVVDMVYFIFAGPGANFGVGDNYLWPHASYIYDPYARDWLSADGVYLGRYACSVELYGRQSDKMLDGIGTMCHEFGHVLGLPDLYDTDYEGGGGQSNVPGQWSVMSGGSYNNYSRTPTGYTLYERYALGFAQPELIHSKGNYNLDFLGRSTQGYRINTPQRNEFFLLENRQQKKWDSYLPGHGMLVFRCDSTSSRVWENNTVNCNPAHNYFELLRATPGRSGSDTAGDPFPGSGKVTELGNSTAPANLLSWAKLENDYELINISERDSIISFRVIDLNEGVEPESISLGQPHTIGVGMTLALSASVLPTRASYSLTWASSDTAIALVDTLGIVKGVSPGTVTISATSQNGIVGTVSITVEQEPLAASVDELKLIGEGNSARLNLDGAQVLLVSGTDVYVRLNGSGIILHDMGTDLKVGNILKGSLYGQYGLSVTLIPQLSSVPLRTYPTDVEVASNAEPQPTVVRLKDLTDANLGDLVLIEKTTFERSTVDGTTYMLARQKDYSEGMITYNRLRLSLNAVKDFAGKQFNITAIYAHLPGSTTVYELEMAANLIDVTQRHRLEYHISDGGHVMMGNTRFEGNGYHNILDDEEPLLVIVPDEGYELVSVLYDDAEQLPLSLDMQLQLPPVTAPHVLHFVFAEADPITDGIGSRQTTTRQELLYRLGNGVYIVREGDRVVKRQTGRR